MVRQTPPDVDMFDLMLSPGERPRLFLDMVAFIEMGRDRRTYRFFQDRAHGRVLIAETQQIERIVAAVTDYVARRLIERKKALAVECGDHEPAVWAAAPAAPSAAAPSPKPPEAELKSQPRGRGEPARAEKGWGARIADAFAFLLMTLGSITLICLLALGGYAVWAIRLRELWAHWFRLSWP